MAKIKLKLKHFLLFVLVAWIIITIMWHSELINYICSKEEPVMMTYNEENVAEESAMRVENPEINDVVAEKEDVIDILRVVFTGLLTGAQLLGGVILIWQKVLGRRK